MCMVKRGSSMLSHYILHVAVCVHEGLCMSTYVYVRIYASLCTGCPVRIWSAMFGRHPKPCLLHIYLMEMQILIGGNVSPPNGRAGFGGEQRSRRRVCTPQGGEVITILITLTRWYVPM